MQKLILYLIPILFLSGPSFGLSEKMEISPRTHKIANEFGRDVKRGDLPSLTNKALDSIILRGATELKAKGHSGEAEKMLSEWENQWRGNLLSRDLGDHAPLSQWLAEKYDMMEFILGKSVCHALRLDDIKTINYAIPVVFKCIDDVDVAEYEKHFVPLMGVVSYWSTLIGCTIGTWGTGFMFCGPIAMGVEYITETFVAPKLNPYAWEKACK